MSDLTWTPVKIKLGQIRQWKNNPRYSTKKDAANLVKSLKDFGQPEAFSVSPFDGNMVDLYNGHQRTLSWMASKGADFEVWAMQSNRPLTEREKEKLTIFLHTGAVGRWNWDALSGWSAADLREWGMDEDTLKGWQSDAKELTELLNSEQAESADAEPQIDRAAELLEKWKVQTGDLWQIGEHRLLCGDSTKREGVERVMGGEKVDMVFTSPPYNQGNSAGGLFSHGKRVENLYPHSEDDMSDSEYMDFLFSILDRCSEIVNDLHSVVWNVAYNAKSRSLYGKVVFSERNPFSVFESIVWNKGGAINLPQVGIYSRWCEFVYVMARGEKYLTSQVYGNPRWNYWETKKQNQLREHHATFPIEFAERAVSELSLENCVVFEPFGGSGTTLVACQNLGRKCRAIEISPAYCSVILERMSTAFPQLEIKRL